MTKLLTNSKVIVSSHTVFNWGPGEMLTLYLKNNKELLSIRHPFCVKVDQPSFYELYYDSQKIEEKTISKTYPELISYHNDFIVTIRLVLNQKKKYDLFIGIDPLNGFIGLILRHLGKVDTVVFYLIDLNPTRFENKFLNFLYHKLEKFCFKYSDSVWCLTEKIKNTIASQGVNQNKCIYTPIQTEWVSEKKKLKILNHV